MQFIRESGEVVFIPVPFEQHPIARKILGFGELQRGWRYGEGIPATQSVIGDALRLHDFALSLGILDTDAFPGVNGEIQFIAHFYHNSMEFTIENGEIEFVYEIDGDEYEMEDAISLDSALSKLRSLRESLCSSSDYSDTSSTIDHRGAFRALPFRSVRATVAFQSLAWTAFSKEIEPSASTSENSIVQIHPIQHSSGAFHLKFSPTTTA